MTRQEIMAVASAQARAGKKVIVMSREAGTGDEQLLVASVVGLVRGHLILDDGGKTKGLSLDGIQSIEPSPEWSGAQPRRRTGPAVPHQPPADVDEESQP